MLCGPLSLRRVRIGGGTLSEMFDQRVQNDPTTPFLHCGATTGRWLTLGELDLRSSRLAAGLSGIGVGRGDRVALLMPNRLEMIEILLAMAKLGSIQVPLNYWLKGDLLRYQLADCGARVLIADETGLGTVAPLLDGTSIDRVVLLDANDPRAIGYGDLLEDTVVQPVRARPGDLLSISYTSGTTAEPKGCMLSTGYYVSVGRSYGDRRWVVPGDRVYAAFPLFHTSGQMVAFMSALVNDASIAVAPEFHASRFMSDAATIGATMLIGVGFHATAILHRPPDPADSAHPFRLAAWVPLPAEQQLQFEKRFNTPVVSEGYGQTECVPISASHVDGPRNVSSSGQPAPLVEIQIEAEDGTSAATGEVGEIVVRPKVSHAMFSGYWNRPQETVTTWRNLWHHTGDLGRIDGDGFVNFVDRRKDVIRRRGENISSAHIEGVLRELHEIADVAVCALPSPVGDDDIKACVVESSRGSIGPEMLFDFLRHRLPYFAIPRYIHLHESLPVNALGRVMKHKLRDEGLPSDHWDFEKLGLIVPRAERRGPAPSPKATSRL